MMVIAADSCKLLATLTTTIIGLTCVSDLDIKRCSPWDCHRISVYNWVPLICKFLTYLIIFISGESHCRKCWWSCPRTSGCQLGKVFIPFGLSIPYLCIHFQISLNALLYVFHSCVIWRRVEWCFSSVIFNDVVWIFYVAETRRFVGNSFPTCLSTTSQKGQSFLDSNTKGTNLCISLHLSWHLYK